MNSLKTINFWAVAVSIAGLVAVNAFAQDVQHGRISYTAESGLIKGVDDDEWAYAGLNSIVMPGDTIWADEEGVLEVEFSGGTFLRLADGSRLDVVSTPPEAVLRGWTGSFYVQRVSSPVGDVVFETPVARVHIEPDSQVRIDVLDEGPSTVSVRWGRAVIHTDIGEPVRVEAGERSYIDPGYLPSTPVEFDRGVEDVFDTWNRDRARQIAYGNQDVPIASAGSLSAPIGVSDLNAYGEWVYIDDQTYWRPTIDDYVPYRNGYWSYVPAQGYVWVGHHPFSYVTSHHGYWSHHDDYGWLWQYHQAYSPAYVFSVRYGDQFIWAPIDPYGYPVYHSYDYFTIGGIYFSLGFSTFSYSHELLFGHHISHALHRSHIQHHNNDYHYWNIYARDSRYDTHVRPHWPRDRVRNYAPQRVLRGPTQNRDKTRLARERVARLETRTGRDRFAVSNPRNNRGVRTSIASRDRRSAVREVTIAYEGLCGDLNCRPLTAVVLQGLLSPLMEGVNMVNAPAIAKERDIHVREIRSGEAGAFQTLVTLTVTTENQTRSIAGTLFNEEPRVVRIKGIPIDAKLGPNMLYLTNEDKPGIIGGVGTILGDAGVNIATFHLGRSQEGGDAIALIEIDGRPADELVRKIAALDSVTTAIPMTF